MPNIIDLLERSGHDVRQTGKPEEFIIQCPVCGKWKLYVNSEKSVWICYVCDEGGRSRKLFQLLGIDPQETSSPDLDKLRRKAEAAAAARRGQSTENTTPILPSEYKPLPIHSATPPVIGGAILQYLYKRGVTADQIIQRHLGYCARGKYGGCLIVPVFDLDGQVVSFQARRVIGNGPKSLNPPNGKGLLYGVEHAKNHTGLIIVEGPFDAIAVHSLMAEKTPFLSAVALLGHHCSDEQAAYVARVLKPEIVWVALDPDVSTEEKHKVGALLVRNGCHDVRVAELTADPDEVNFDQWIDALTNAQCAKPVAP